MRYFKKVLFAAVSAGLLFSMGACKKSEVKENAQQAAETVHHEIAQTAEAIQDFIAGDWNKAEVNGFLKYIPEDTPFVWASTREFDINSPEIKSLLTFAKKSFDMSNNLLDAVAKDPKMGAKLSAEDIALLKKFTELFANYPQNAPEYGLNPVHYEYASYIRDGVLVFKFAVDDSAKLRTKVDELLTSIKNNQKNVFTVSEFAAANDKFVEYAFYDMGDQFSFAIHYGSKVATLVWGYDKANPEKLSQTLEPAAKPLPKEALGKVESNVAQLGFVDNTRTISMLLASSKFRKVLEEIAGDEIPQECDAEIQAMIADYPRINFASRFLDEHSTYDEVTLVVANKDELKAIQDMRGTSLELSNSNALMALDLDISLAKLLNYWMAKAASISAKTYHCPALAKIARGLNKLPARINDPSNAVQKGFILGLTGGHLVIDKLDLSKIKDKQLGLEAILDINGPGVPMLSALMGTVSPELANLNANAQAPVTIDLSKNKQIDLPVIVKAYLTNTDFMIASDNYDVKALASGTPKTKDTFIKFQMNFAPIAQIMKHLPFNDPKSELYQTLIEIYQNMDIHMVYSIGVDNSGLNATVKYTIK